MAETKAHKIEMRMRVKNVFDKPEIIMDFILLPRGSGNRNKARRLGEVIRNHEFIGKSSGHLRKVVVGATRVTAHFYATLAFRRAMKEMEKRAEEQRDVDGQLGLFGGL